MSVLKVKALGDTDRVAGYYNHKRVMGGQVFVLKPYKKKVEGKKDLILVTAEEQFSELWMEKLTPKQNYESQEAENVDDVDSLLGFDSDSADSDEELDVI